MSAKTILCVSMIAMVGMMMPNVASIAIAVAIDLLRQRGVLRS